MPRKADADEILRHMKRLRESDWLERSRRFWPLWLYRSDHVENAARILNSGRLLSRAAAERDDVIRVDSGSPQYVNELSERHRSLVRLYFRPRTPTQYVNEGIRPKGQIQLEAHMPVPVYLVFSFRLLGEQGVWFTKGRLSDSAEVGDSAAFLKSIDFRDVYHDRGVGERGGARRRSILNARHSEVVVPDELALDELKHVVCRSAPERDTLLNLLSKKARRRWVKRTRVDEGDRRLFERRGTFVQRVDLSQSECRFVFYPSAEVAMRGPFDLRIERRLGKGKVASARRKEWTVPKDPVTVRFDRPAARYRVRVLLDGNLAYLGNFDEGDKPGVLV